MVERTEDIYARCLRHYREWCLEQGLRFPPTDHRKVALYLAQCRKSRGLYMARVHMSAIGRFMRDRGLVFDTQHAQVRQVMRSDRGAGPRPN